MADDERAAKAARAKAMLKKRQQQKKAGTPLAGSEIDSSNSPVSRAISPAPSQANGTGNAINEFGELLSSNTPIDRTIPDENAMEPPLSAQSELMSAPQKTADKQTSQLLQDQRQTISLLISEKTSLSEALQRYEATDQELRNKENELKESFQNMQDLYGKLSLAEKERDSYSVQAQELRSENTQLTTKLHDQQREVLMTRNEADTLRSRVEDRERRTRELEEQIQNDDRVEILESKLKNTQDRAEEVSFQLSKLKQSFDKLQSNNNETQVQLQLRCAVEEELGKKATILESKCSSLEDEASRLASEKEILQSQNDLLIEQLRSSKDEITALELKLSQVELELNSTSLRLEGYQVELNTALERATNAERSQRDVQEEATGLMHSLDEMRPKIVELTGVKLELMENVDHLTKTVHQRDATISHLEGLLDQSRNESANAETEKEKLRREHESERKAVDKDFAELQQVYHELQKQHDDILASVRELDADRNKLRVMNVKLDKEVENLLSAKQSQYADISSLQERLEERSTAQEDIQRLVEELQSDIEALRAELMSKEDEILRIRQSTTGDSSPVRQNFNDEVQNALKQQYDLDISAAQANIRGLETTAFEAEAKYLSVQKHVAILEDEIAQLRSRTGRPYAFHSTDSFTTRLSDDPRRPSLTSQRSDDISHLPAAAFLDRSLPPATRHQRHVSLAMLQARIYSEAEAAAGFHVFSPTHNARSLHAQAESPSPGVNAHELDRDSIDAAHHLRKPQFLDESHVFWCASCKGDLIVL